MVGGPSKGPDFVPCQGKLIAHVGLKSRAGDAVLVSPGLQRGESDPAMIEPESRRDGAFSSHAFFQLLRKIEWKNTNWGDSRKCQTVTATPAKPGGFPVVIRRFAPPHDRKVVGR
jgi:hypothetical protein